MAGFDLGFVGAQNSLRNQQAMLMATQSMKASEKITDTDTNKRSSQPGTMYVNDSFIPSDMYEATVKTENPHGVQVARSARQQGFQGKIEGAGQHASSHDYARNSGWQDLGGRPLEQKEARKAVQQIVSGSASGLLDSQAQYLDGLTKRGARNSAANLSLGTSKARLTRDLYSQASMGWNTDPSMPPQMRQGANQTLSNMATAYGLDVNKLRSKDPKVNGPERQILQQRLLDNVGATMDRDPAIAAEKKKWAASVANFESHNNSVVISAGNEGAHIEKLEKSNGGRPLRAPADVSTNILENEQVTTVGATRWFESDKGLKEYRAGYSSDSNGVDIYASGALGINNRSKMDIDGTSFASPRVAAAMAELHKKHPGKSSSEIEAMLKEQLTHQLPSGNASLPVLDFGLTANFLSRR